VTFGALGEILCVAQSAMPAKAHAANT